MKEIITVIVKKRANSAMRPMIDTLPRCRFILFLRLCDKCSLQRESSEKNNLVPRAFSPVWSCWLVGDEQARKDDP